MKTKKFVHRDAEGNDWGIVSTEQLWADVYALKYNRPTVPLCQEAWTDLFANAKAAAVEFGAKTIWARLRSDYEPEMFRMILKQIGFQKKSERIEYQCDVVNLPDEDGSPFEWKSLKQLDWDEARLAQFTAEITKGALDIDPDEKPEDFIKDWLNHHELTSGLDCIAVGFVTDKAAALVVAQINKSTGWSRLSYLGILPEYRGRGFGKWVQRHGFSMMKDQGGKLYHGGTHAENLPMKKLFESHGCKFSGAMEEWSCTVIGNF